MMQTITSDDILLRSESQLEPEWLQQRRLQALQQESILPAFDITRTTVKRWDYTKGSLVPFFDLDERVYSFQAADDRPMLVQQEDQTCVEQLAVDDIEKGLIVCSIQEALAEHEELIKPYLFQKAPVDQVDAYHEAVVQAGVFIYVPKQMVLTQPIELYFFQGETADNFYGKEIIVVAEENAKVEIIERNQALSDDNQYERSLSQRTLIFAKEGASVQYSASDAFNEKITGRIVRQADVQKDASVNWTMVAVNQGKVAYDVQTNLIGSGSHSESQMIALSEGKSQQVFMVKTDNIADHSIGHINQRGIVRGKGQVIFNGIGHIASTGHEAEAMQESRILMMTDSGRGDANPILLIDHDDVKASHAASIGQLNEEDVFYLMSRGLSRKEAEQVVAKGFITPIMNHLSTTIQSDLWEFIDRKLRLDV